MYMVLCSIFRYCWNAVDLFISVGLTDEDILSTKLTSKDYVTSRYHLYRLIEMFESIEILLLHLHLCI